MFCIYNLMWLTLAVAIPSWGENKMVQGPEIGFLNVDKVWAKGYTGKGIVVAVVDHGVSKNHEDLKQNYNASLSYDFVNDKSEPKPSIMSSHGTKCAGIIAAKKDGTCRQGIAYKAQIADLLVINGTSAHDAPTAKGLRYKKNKLIHIYSNSWGPKDNGFSVHGPGPLVKSALKKGVKRGRFHRGSIFVYSSGNGGRVKDSCAFDGYVNSIYTIAIGAVTKSGMAPNYAESCSSVIAVTYGDNVNTCDRTGCVRNFGRTSAAAAMASGIIALLLEANNQLTWRDVQHLIVRTSKPNRQVNNGKNWIVNGAGLMVHPALGFGIMDANKLVEAATNNWQRVPKQQICSIEFIKQRNTFNRERNYVMIYPRDTPNCLKIKYIEHVQVEFSLSFDPRGLLEMFLQSPHGTISQLLYSRLKDALTRRKTFNNLVVTSLHFWGENVTAMTGKWKLFFKSGLFRYRNIQGTLSKFKITFYGTGRDPVTGGGLAKDTKSCRHGNVIKNFWSGYGAHCCGDIGIYDNIVAKCCKGEKLVPKYSLCGSFEYDQCTQLCCNGHIHDRLERITSCCGRTTYNMNTQICCNGRAEQKYSCRLGWRDRWGKYYVISEAECGYDGVFYKRYYEKPCTATTAPPTEEMTSTTIPPTPPAPATTEAFSSSLHIIIRERKQLEIYKGLSKFKTTTNGTIQDRVTGVGIVKVPNLKPCKNECCKGERIVPKYSLCGSFEYDQCTQLCCDGHIHDRLERITSCCGRNTYNMNTQICCNGRAEQRYSCRRIRRYSWIKYYAIYEKKCGDRGVFYKDPYHKTQCPATTVPPTEDTASTATSPTPPPPTTTKVCQDSSPTEDCQYWKSNKNFCNRDDAHKYCAKTCGECK